MQQKILIISLIVLNIFSCKKKEKNTSDADFKLYNLASAGWKSKTMTHTLSDIDFKATQVPIQYYILKNADSKEAAYIDSIYKLHSKERIIEFEFKHDSKDDLLKNKYTKKDYTESVKYMSFKIENDFKVVTQSGDTIPCAGVHFERNFKLAPFKRLLLHFGNIPENENIQLVYNDNLFKNGLLKYQFKETPIKL